MINTGQPQWLKVNFVRLIHEWRLISVLTSLNNLIKENYSMLRLPRGLCEAHLLQDYRPCVIGAIPSHTYRNVCT